MRQKNGVLAAADYDNYVLLRELIDNGVDVNYQDKYGRTALSILAKNSSPTIEDVENIKYLLEHGADVNIEDKNGKKAFDDCAYKICQLNPEGMRKFAPDDATIVPTLDQALRENDCTTIVDFINNGVDPFIEIYGTALFFRLYHQDHRKCLKDVLELGIDLNKINIFRDSGGRINGKVDTALTYANRYFWSRDLVPLLKQYGAVETDDTKRVSEYNEMRGKYGYPYSKQAVTELKQKLKKKDLKDWEILVYQDLLEKQKTYQRIQTKQRDYQEDLGTF